MAGIELSLSLSYKCEDKYEKLEPTEESQTQWHRLWSEQLMGTESQPLVRAGSQPSRLDEHHASERLCLKNQG